MNTCRRLVQSVSQRIFLRIGWLMYCVFKIRDRPDCLCPPRFLGSLRWRYAGLKWGYHMRNSISHLDRRPFHTRFTLACRVRDGSLRAPVIVFFFFLPRVTYQQISDWWVFSLCQTHDHTVTLAGNEPRADRLNGKVQIEHFCVWAKVGLEIFIIY